MKSKHTLDVERAELAVEANLAKFSSAVDHLEDKIVEGQTKVAKVKHIVNRPKEILDQVSDKAHDLTEKVAISAHNLSDRAQTVAGPYVDRTLDLGTRFWNRAEAHPVPFIIGAAALFGGMIYLLFTQSEIESEDSLWGY